MTAASFMASGVARNAYALHAERMLANCDKTEFAD